MNVRPLAFAAIIVFSLSGAVSARAESGTMLFSDDFERTGLGAWKEMVPSFDVRGGELVAKQGRDDHGAVGRVLVPMKDVVVDFRFRFDGSPSFNAVFDDKSYKGSHAGHICRVAFTPKQVRLGDDKEGLMRNDIFAMRKDKARKAEAEAELVGRSAAAPVTLERDAWHDARIEIIGDLMKVAVDGKPVADLRSPGIAHDTKSSFHFTVTGPGMRFDDVRIRAAR
jgi:hypothetical protein